MFNTEMIRGKRFLITGATGLVGQAVIKYLRALNCEVDIIALVRNKEKAVKILGEETKKFRYLIGDIKFVEIENLAINYIIHGASQTSSKAFVYEPVETIMTAFLGTKNMLEVGKKNAVESFVYLSSMEVYGYPLTDEKINENYNSNLDPMTVRSCYPESKRMCENLCVSYASEYGIPAKVVRLTQTFGPGVSYMDGRVFAEFARCVIEKKNIILKTKGETKRNYLYIEDAVKAILTVLLEGNSGEAYNVANEETYCSIFEMANMVVENWSNSGIQVLIDDKKNTEKLGYAPVLHMNLDTSKIRKLGWKPECDLKTMFDRMISYMKIQKDNKQ